MSVNNREIFWTDWCQAFDGRRHLFCCLKRPHPEEQHKTMHGIRFNVSISRPKEPSDLGIRDLSFRFDGRR